MIVLVLLLLFLALLAFQDERVAGYRYVDVLSIKTRQFRGDLIGVVIFAQIDRRRGERERGRRAPRRLDFEHASQRRKTKSVEQPVQFAAKRPPHVRRSRLRRGRLLHFNGYVGHLCLHHSPRKETSSIYSSGIPA